VLFGADSNIDLAQVLFDLGGVQFGSFDLPGTAGQSPIYINPRVLSSEPQMLRRVAKMLNIEIRADASRRRPRLESFAVVAGVPMGGVHIATAYAIESNTPLVFLRPTYHPDDHQDSIEGHVVPGQSAIVIDDLMTGGRSILTTAMRLERVNMRVRDAIVLIDREQGGVERLHEHGYHVTPILRLKTMLNYYYASDLIDRDTFDRCMWYLEDHHWSRQPDSELDG
jgi:orotate phosphoribosyltransferase/uridine monophosphate synthetase